MRTTKQPSLRFPGTGKLEASVLSHVRSKQGQRLEKIGRALRTDTGVLKKPVADLLKAKRLKTKGQKRGTKYFSR
jgi:hypothetical protein